MKNRTVEQYAVVPPGFEPVCAAELAALGITGIRQEKGGVRWQGGLRELYLANLWLRTASRVLVRFAELTVRDFPTLFRRAARLSWGEFVRPGQRVAFRVTSRRSRLMHTGRISETLALALRHALGDPPDNPELPEQQVVVRLHQDRMLLSIDSSGEHLHRRGYRRLQGKAPLRENLAAGMLLLAGWNGETPLVDPFCGAGTLPIEAALIAGRIPPGQMRTFAFMHWPGYRAGLWKLLLDEARRHRRPLPAALIVAGDSDAAVLDLARQNAETAGVGEAIAWSRNDFAAIGLPECPGLVVANPPYGERLGDDAEVRRLYRRLGECCQRQWRDWNKAILTPNPAWLGDWARGRPHLPLRNGGLAVWLVRDAVFAN
ncbi:putative N6-adenine-specific DNA methylase [Geothermobacter ehrlichii]|uniref:Putative N6-adenine-specific DNA methylase n=1 Tax=Geothermobacter ehrlichii TaxID=213224 RepID=A0A5D3WHY9_9BACT|nr:class I SAM-dependent RNA methyltransferase [Geothermobacter ehrlichii]TYO97087.1 putative N6-adenine-specific DNA methylase [Geothermobacter ehrlichii]